MLSNFILAFGQIFSKPFRAVLWKAMGLTVLLFIALYMLLGYFMGFLPEHFTLFGWQVGWLDSVITALGWGLGALLPFFLMFPLAALFIGLFLEDIADAVDERYYPSLPKAGRMSFIEMLLDGLQFAAVLIGANLVGLIFYILLAPIAPFIFLAINGYLLGRQYFELVASRRMKMKEARQWRREHNGAVWIAGIVMAVPLSIPVVNLFIPLLGVATFTHMFNKSKGQQPVLNSFN